MTRPPGLSCLPRRKPGRTHLNRRHCAIGKRSALAISASPEPRPIPESACLLHGQSVPLKPCRCRFEGSSFGLLSAKLIAPKSTLSEHNSPRTRSSLSQFLKRIPCCVHVAWSCRQCLGGLENKRK